MNNSDYAFSPMLSIQSTDKAIPEIKSRELFYQLNYPEKTAELISLAHGFITFRLKQARQVYSPLSIQGYTQENLLSLKVAKISPLTKPLQTVENQRQCVKQTASILLTQPYWLQNTLQISSSQTITATQLTSIYLHFTQGEQDNLNLQNHCHSLLLSIGIKIPALHSYAYSQQAELIPEMFTFASTQLALAQFPRVLFAEILGFTLAYCQMPTLIETCFSTHQLPCSFFKHRHQRVNNQLQPLYDCIEDYLNLFPQQQQVLWQRIQNGFWLYQQQMQDCRDAFEKSLGKALSPQQAVAELFQKKAFAAIGHHQKIQLNGQSLDKWFAGMPENSQSFLQALKQSNYIDKQPANSRLLKLFSFKGPMFGVLDKSEQNIVLDWLKSDIGEITLTPPSEANISAPITIKASKNQVTPNNRELYYHLLNADLFPESLATAKNKAGKLLQACSLFTRLPFKHYSHQQFDLYIESIYQREIKAYHPLQNKPKISKEAYRWGIEQIAPMILIDGCWLQNSLNLQAINPEICDILFKIYADEIGNGQLKQNHPYIFQQLLNSLSIQLPPAHSAKFIKHTAFINSAFDLPVYMLSLSHFSITFLPELLGLNMAIELSGLGKDYMTLVDEWDYWRIDSSIAKIHISIDNYASGHTFLAKKAIQLYMDDILQSTGSRIILDHHWRRIYTGYASLRFVGKRFKLGLPVHYLMNKLT